MGIVHRDISLDNIILVPETPKRWRTGYIIDFDYAIKDEQGREIASGERTVSICDCEMHITQLTIMYALLGHRAIYGARCLTERSNGPGETFSDS